MGALRTSSPRFRRIGTPVPIKLTPDDIAILRHVHRHRFIRADDLYRLFPSRSPDKLSRRLTWLYRNAFLDRPIAQIDRFKSGGSQSLVYGIDTAGARLLQEQDKLAMRTTGWKARNRDYTRENLDHTLAVTRFMVDLEIACLARVDVDLIRFETILSAAPESTQRQAQPDRWPVVLPWHGSHAVVKIAPDAIFGLCVEQPDGQVRRAFFFLEMDRGTMTIAPSYAVRRSDAFLYRSSILRKLLAYGISHQNAEHQGHLGIHAAQVLTLTSPASRATEMQKVAAALIVPALKIPSGFFLFGTYDDGASPLESMFRAADCSETKLLRD